MFTKRAGAFVVGVSVLALSTLGVTAGCTTTTRVVDNRDGSASSSGGNDNLPLVDADQLGGSCSGFGTSPGNTAAFATDKCPAGVCLVETRGTFELYCSADCDKVRCPTGWLCQDVDLGLKRACFKDPNAAVDPEQDAGPPAKAAFTDEKLLGYRANSSSTAMLALADFQDKTAAKSDLVVVIIGGLWDRYGNDQLADLQTSTLPRVTWVGVVMNGTAPGSAATPSHLAMWHSKYPATNLLLDSKMEKLESGFGIPTALPTIVGLDARTLDEVGRDVGYHEESALKTLIDGWRAKLK